jgi:hypothetical protein
MSMLLSLALLWATTFPIMYVDQKMRVGKAAKTDVPDLRDKSFAIYYLLALFSGMLILPIYFFVTRGRPIGLLVGLGWAVVAGLVSFFLRVLIVMTMGLAH